MKITLQGQNDKNKNIRITLPVNPQKIVYSTAGRFQEYTILNKGTAKVPNGEEITTFKWDSFLPGKELQQFKFIKPTNSTAARRKNSWRTKPPKEIHNQLDYWRRKGTKLTLTITESPFTQRQVYIESYNATLAGPDGSIYYDITLAQAIDVTVETVKKNKNTASKKRPSKNTNAKKYTVKKGDSLWSIARRFYKDSKKWKKIYTANKSKIESRAKKAGKKSSNKGHLLYPGTVLKIPS